MTTNKRLASVMLDVAAEVETASARHRSLASSHEAYAVILEELDEFWEEVRKKRSERDPAAMALELRQVAAMAVRTILDLRLDQ